jgi:ABC-type lipoprotein export system ATPase subunit
MVEGNIGSGKSTFLQYFKQSDKVEVKVFPFINQVLALIFTGQMWLVL